MKVTFFGHRDAPEVVRSKIKALLLSLIEQQGADAFYVGEQGAFDRMVTGVLTELKEAFPHIRCYTVLAYLPSEKEREGAHQLDTLLPDNIESAPPRFAITRRNRWMIEQADTVVVYVVRGFGGAAQFMQLADKKGKRVINLAE